MATLTQLVDQPRAPASILFNVVGHVFNRPQRVRIAALEVDATLSEVHEAEAEATEHPVETGVVVADHVILKPRRYRMEGLVTNAPIGLSLVALQKRWTALRTSDPSIDAPFAAERLSAVAFATLNGLLEAREFVTVVTPLAKYSDLVLVALSFPRDAHTGDALRFSATFKQVRKVTASEVQVQTFSPDGPAAPKADLGPQATKTTSAPVKERSQSTLLEAFDAGVSFARKLF